MKWFRRPKRRVRGRAGGRGRPKGPSQDMHVAGGAAVGVSMRVQSLIKGKMTFGIAMTVDGV